MHFARCKLSGIPGVFALMTAAVRREDMSSQANAVGCLHAYPAFNPRDKLSIMWRKMGIVGRSRGQASCLNRFTAVRRMMLSGPICRICFVEHSRL